MNHEANTNDMSAHATPVILQIDLKKVTVVEQLEDETSQVAGIRMSDPDAPGGEVLVAVTEGLVGEAACVRLVLSTQSASQMVAVGTLNFHLVAGGDGASTLVLGVSWLARPGESLSTSDVQMLFLDVEPTSTSVTSNPPEPYIEHAENKLIPLWGTGRTIADNITPIMGHMGNAIYQYLAGNNASWQDDQTSDIVQQIAIAIYRHFLIECTLDQPREPWLPG
ncbi:MAG: hypothetical protein AAF639_12005 [Chloroflexota bacterium]